MPNKEKRVAQGTILSGSTAKLLRERGAKIESAWTPNPSQVKALHRLEFEILAAGGKYGGKTEMSRMWMVGGNPDKPDYDWEGKPLLCNMSYVYHPHFLGAVIRLNEKDLAEWVDRARDYYEGVLGGTYTKNPSEFRWPSGARVFLGHAQDSNAWTKYQGQNIVRFLIEEAGQIPDIETFDMIRSCCRSLYPEMRAQIMLTANPGGPGQQWLYDRFIEPRDREGKPVKHPTDNRPILESDGGLITIVEKAINPYNGETIETTRVWVPSYLSDNPYALQDTNYIATLATMRNEKMKKAYLYGDWKAMQGTYFDIFSKQSHTYDPKVRDVPSWTLATGSLDWGFVHQSAAYWHKQCPSTKQHLIYKEFCTSGTDPIELGRELARRSKDELKFQDSIIFHVSHDLFHDKTGEFTWVELIAKGVQKELGKESCYLPDILITKLKDSYRMDGKEWSEDIEERIISRKTSGIVFRRAPKARAVGFMHLYTLMRTESNQPPPVPIDWDMALKISQEGSLEDYSNFIRSFAYEKEYLPELLISTDCETLINAIPKAIHSETDPEDIDKTHFLGMDSLDSLRYLMTGIRDNPISKMPSQLRKESRIAEALKRNPTLTTQDLIWIASSIEENISSEEKGAESFSLGRSARAIRYMQ